MTRELIESEKVEMQRLDDAFRDKLLGPTCFCGATGRSDACAPLKCLAHGYCEAHSTPVAAQMTLDDKARIARRCGFDLNRVL
jgi:hypothetical protein